MVGINNLNNIIRIRRDVEALMRKLKEFVEDNDIEDKMETVCNTDKIKLMCMPNGCVIHILDGDKARYSLIISNPPELTIIDWSSKTTQNLNNDEEVNRILRELGAEEDIEECISEYIAEKEELLSKLKAVMTLLNIL